MILQTPCLYKVPIPTTYSSNTKVPAPTTYSSNDMGVALISSQVGKVSVFGSRPIYGHSVVFHHTAALGSARAGCGAQVFASRLLPPPPPPSPPPMPPLAPGAKMMFELQLSFIANGTVADFGA